MLHNEAVGLTERPFLEIYILEATCFPFLQCAKYLASTAVRAIRCRNLSHVTAVAANASVAYGTGLKES